MLKADDYKQLCKELLEIVEDNEWQIRNAAGNTYCPYCETEDDRWSDQKEHHDGCKYIKIVEKARNAIVS